MGRKDTKIVSEKQSSDNLAKIFISICLSLILLVAIGSIILVSKKTKTPVVSSEIVSLDIIDGKQVVNVLAKNGFNPNVVTARADMPTILKVKTDNTFDCSASMSIPKLGIRESLPPTGSTNVEIPAQKEGTSLDVTCSMNMFHMTVNFIKQS